MRNPTRTVKFFGDVARPKEDECRRRWGRYPVRDAIVIVTTDTHIFEATTVNESIGGLALLTTDIVTLFPDQRITITYHEEEMQGVVASVVEREDGARQFSVRWPKRRANIDLTREHPFLAINGIVVACQIIGGEDESPARIRLWNGREFEVEVEELIFRTKEARQSELRAMGDEVKMLAKIYGLELRLCLEVLIDRILDLEFAGSVV